MQKFTKFIFLFCVSAVLASLPEDARRAMRYALLLDKMKSGDAALLMPFDLRIK